MEMTDRDSVISDLSVAKLILCNPQMLTPKMCIRIGQAITSSIFLLKEQEPKPELPVDIRHANERFATKTTKRIEK